MPSSSACAACKHLRRKCQPGCVLAPYFPADQPQKFMHVNETFGATNVKNLLSELPVYQREAAANSLSYEAEYRLRDPVYGCVGVIYSLEEKLTQLQHTLSLAKQELASYAGQNAAATAPYFQHPDLMHHHPDNNNHIVYAAMGLPPNGLPPPALHVAGAQQQQQRAPALEHTQSHQHQYHQLQQQQQQLQGNQQEEVNKSHD